MAKYGPPAAPVDQRFWKRAGVDGNCWPWMGARLPNGYGRFRLNEPRTVILAHRYAWQSTRMRPLPQGMYVCHHCDNPSCVRPSHLFLGTPEDNQRDRFAKGRARVRESEAYDD